MRRAMLRKSSYGGGFDFTTGLVAAWQYENNFNDYTSNHNGIKEGTLNFVSAKVGKGIDFNGIGNITVPNHNDFIFSNGIGVDVKFSLAFWINKPTYHNGVIISKGVGKDFYMSIISRSIKINLYSNISNRLGMKTAAVIPQDTNFYHVVFTYDASKVYTGGMYYINSNKVQTYNASVGNYTGMTAGTGDLDIGSSGTSTRLLSKMDEMKVYKNRVLTQAEISEMHTKELAGISVLP